MKKTKGLFQNLFYVKKKLRNFQKIPVLLKMRNLKTVAYMNKKDIENIRMAKWDCNKNYVYLHKLMCTVKYEK
jgi:hypothetical protein